MKLFKFKNKYVRYTLRTLLAILVIGIIWYFEFIVYGLGQAYGQLNIVWNTKGMKEFLEEGNYPDSTKYKFSRKITLIQEIKDFAVKELGLNGTSNYERIYDQQNKAILWAVTACEPYELKPKEWDYAFLGKMPYKGFFDSTRAYTLKSNLEKQGYDVNVYAPSAWSTLGWLSDPILSNMLYWNDGALASLIIHEMTHGTVWVYGGVEYNENLADFIGERGAKLFLIHKYGKDSKEYTRFLRELSDEEKGFQYILKSTKRLDSLYQTFSPTLPTEMKKSRKEAFITEIVKGFGNLGLLNSKRLKKWLKRLPNNAFFMNYRRYRGKQDLFERECKEQYQDDIKAYLAYLKKKYPA
jgi:predicted aminopeptidase